MTVFVSKGYFYGMNFVKKRKIKDLQKHIPIKALLIHLIEERKKWIQEMP